MPRTSGPPADSASVAEHVRYWKRKIKLPPGRTSPAIRRNIKRLEKRLDETIAKMEKAR